MTASVQTMKTVTPNQRLDAALAPRWTWRSVAGAALLTLGLFLLIPGFERFGDVPAEESMTVREVAIARIPSPPPSPPPETAEEPLPPERPSPARTPLPELATPRRSVPALPVALDWTPPLDDTMGEVMAQPDFGIRVATPVEDAVFRLSDLDAAPRLLARRDPLYPHTARIRGIEGYAVVGFTVGADGSVRDLEIMDSRPGNLFDQATLEAVRQWRFAPGTRNATPVAVRVEQKITFQLE